MTAARASDSPGPHAGPEEIHVLRTLAGAPQGQRLLETAFHLAEGCAVCWASVDQARSLPRPRLPTTDPVVVALRRLSHGPTRTSARRRPLGFAFEMLEATAALVFDASWKGSAARELRGAFDLVWRLEDAHSGEKAAGELRRRALTIRFTYSLFRDHASYRAKLREAAPLECHAEASTAAPGKVAGDLRAAVALHENPLTYHEYVVRVSKLAQLYQDHDQTGALRRLYRQVLRHGSGLRDAIVSHRVGALSEWLPLEAAEVPS